MENRSKSKKMRKMASLVNKDYLQSRAGLQPRKAGGAGRPLPVDRSPRGGPAGYRARLGSACKTPLLLLCGKSGLGDKVRACPEHWLPPLTFPVFRGGLAFSSTHTSAGVYPPRLPGPSPCTFDADDKPLHQEAPGAAPPWTSPAESHPTQGRPTFEARQSWPEESPA